MFEFEIKPILDLIKFHNRSLIFAKPVYLPTPDSSNIIPENSKWKTWPVRGYVISQEKQIAIAGKGYLLDGGLTAYVYGEDYLFLDRHDLFVYWEKRFYQIKEEDKIGDRGRNLIIHLSLQEYSSDQADFTIPPSEHSLDSWANPQNKENSSNSSDLDTHSEPTSIISETDPYSVYFNNGF